MLIIKAEVLTSYDQELQMPRAHDRNNSLPGKSAKIIFRAR